MPIIHRIAQVAKPYRGTLYIGLILGFIATYLDTLTIPILLSALAYLVVGEQFAASDGLDLGPLFKRMMDALTASSDKAHLLVMLAIITLVVVFLKALFMGRHNYLMMKFSNLIGRDMRNRMFSHLTRLSPGQLDGEASGAHLSRITNDVSILQACLGPQLIEVIAAPVMVVMVIGFMFTKDWRLTLTALILAPLITVLIAIAGRQIRKITLRIQQRFGDLNGSLFERISNIRVIQSYVREPYEAQQVSELNQRYFRETMRSVRVLETLAPSIEFIAYTGMILAIIIGGLQILRGEGTLDGQTFLTFLMLGQRVGIQFKRLSRVNQLRQQAEAAGSRIFALLDTPPQIQDAPGAITLPTVCGEVTFDHVSFRYASGDAVLDDVYFTAAPGEAIALVGPSGAGKTTLVNLLPRFYEPTAGRILIDGIDIRQVTLASLREQIGTVPQETILFSGTVYDNILYGRLDAGGEEVIEAARAANALEFIERLPEGFNTLMGERGMRLSGGQRQRVAIARAVLKNPRILILDEATSALDTESEHLVQQALERLMVGRTTFIIAHRLSTVQNATRILVLDRGRIVEAGPHRDLLAQDGLYRRLYDMQFRTPAAPDIGLPPVAEVHET
jgi:subfamily B ATP-binding cassette protein MsbA